MTTTELLEHIDQISKRRWKTDGPHLDELPVVDNQVAAQDVLNVLDYLRKYPARTPGYRHADLTVALRLTIWLWWDERRRQRHWLKAGLSDGMFLSQLAAPLGLSKQGVRDRLDRLDALLRFDRPEAGITRDARRKSVLAGEEMAWIVEHRERIHHLVAEFNAEADRWGLQPEDRPWLDELVTDATDDRDEHTDDGLTPGSMSLLNLAYTELATAEPVAESAARSQPLPVHRLLARADSLGAEFAAIGKKLGPSSAGAPRKRRARLRTP